MRTSKSEDFFENSCGEMLTLISIIRASCVPLSRFSASVYVGPRMDEMQRSSYAATCE